MERMLSRIGCGNEQILQGRRHVAVLVQKAKQGSIVAVQMIIL